MNEVTTWTGLTVYYYKLQFKLFFFFFFLIKGRRITREFGEKEFKNRPAEYTIKFCVTRS